MKKLLPILSLFAFAAASASAEIIEVTPTSSNRQSVHVSHTAADTLQLNSTASWNRYTVGDGLTDTFAKVVVKMATTLARRTSRSAP